MITLRQRAAERPGEFARRAFEAIFPILSESETSEAAKWWCDCVEFNEALLAKEGGRRMNIPEGLSAKLDAGAMALGMLCALYRTGNLPSASIATARQILERSGDLERLDRERAELEAKISSR